jgi:hypothetical protein
MLMRRLLFWLQGRLPTRHLSHLGKPYMERSYLGTFMGLRLYLHRFLACDEEGVHDHPFLYSVSLILAGWYYEDRWARRIARRWFNYIGPNTFHRVVIPEHATHDIWSLFIHTERCKPWGVLRAIARGSHGPLWQYAPKSLPTDPAFSTWHERAPTGKALRDNPSLNIDGIAAFNIPLGLNAYAAGLAQYPDSARRHAQDVDQALLPEMASTELAETSSQMG